MLDHHVQTLAAGDVEAMLADYTEDSVFISSYVTNVGDVFGESCVKAPSEALIDPN